MSGHGGHWLGFISQSWAREARGLSYIYPPSVQRPERIYSTIIPGAGAFDGCMGAAAAVEGTDEASRWPVVVPAMPCVELSPSGMVVEAAEEVHLPDEAVELIPEDDAGLDENSGLSLEEQRRAWKEEAAQAEAQAKEDLAIEGKRGRAQNSAHPV